MSAVKDRADRHGKGALTCPALPTLHRPIPAGMTTHILAVAIGAKRATAPSHRFEVFYRLFLGLKSLENLDDVHG